MGVESVVCPVPRHAQLPANAPGRRPVPKGATEQCARAVLQCAEALNIQFSVGGVIRVHHCRPNAPSPGCPGANVPVVTDQFLRVATARQSDAGEEKKEKDKTGARHARKVQSSNS